MFECEKKKMLECALKLDRYGLISLSGGNISMRMPDGNFLITPSGMIYDEMVPEDIVLVNAKGDVVEGCRKPSSDTAALLHIFEKMSHVNAVIHTHQPYATAVGLVEEILPEFLVTIIDACRSAVHVAPFTPSADKEMGVLTVQYAGDAQAVILKHHGVMAFGPTLYDALYSAVYLEESAKTYIHAKSIGNIPTLKEEDITQEANSWLTYGQK